MTSQVSRSSLHLIGMSVVPVPTTTTTFHPTSSTSSSLPPILLKAHANILLSLTGLHDLMTTLLTNYPERPTDLPPSAFSDESDQSIPSIPHPLCHQLHLITLKLHCLLHTVQVFLQHIDPSSSPNHDPAPFDNLQVFDLLCHLDRKLISLDLCPLIGEIQDMLYGADEGRDPDVEWIGVCQSLGEMVHGMEWRTLVAMETSQWRTVKGVLEKTMRGMEALMGVDWREVARRLYGGAGEAEMEMVREKVKRVMWEWATEGRSVRRVGRGSALAELAEVFVEMGLEVDDGADNAGTGA